ncbi:Toxin RTX-I translocation ATP-binding protein [Termitomyces sp. J132]|nr:Toxin RTX-I translocation ATP-binding protein [Termitomyces sp. J132]
MLKDVGSIRACWFHLALYLIVECIASLVPAVSLWYSAQLLKIVQSAIDERAVNERLLFKIAAGRLGCLFVTRLMRYSKKRCVTPLNIRIKRFYSLHTFRAMGRLDVPTFDDDAVQRQLEQSVSPNSSTTIAWETISTTLSGLAMLLQLISQFSVLVNVLRDQRDGTLLAVLSFAQTVFARNSFTRTFLSTAVWAATTKNAEYIRMEGLKRTVSHATHRKEIVAGGLQEYLFDQFKRSSQAVGDRAGNFMELLRIHRMAQLSLFSFLEDPLRELPQIVFTLRAVQYPASIPVSLASLNLITHTAAGFTHTLVSLYDETGSLAQMFADIRRMYEVENIPNRVSDGTVPFPEEEQSLEMGISVEFRNVFFRYPASEAYALENVSFKIEKGQLCIIVGANGSGKSTVLKLIARLYEPESGEILIDGKNIKRLKLDHLRRAISVLFQDYTHFPLSIKENIGLGDPKNAADEDKIRQAAHMGGADEFIERLPEGFETYLERPVKDYYSALPEGTTSLFGRVIDYGRIRSIGKMEGSSSKSLSGGQMQRIALQVVIFEYLYDVHTLQHRSRTFMRSLVSQPKVGLLLFDEPSASLDPKAEYDLFERLRVLRGNKTMIFSSHRFGNLTRHADLILYMNDAVIVEKGTHEELLKEDGEYGEIWRLQAQAFV